MKKVFRVEILDFKMSKFLLVFFSVAGILFPYDKLKENLVLTQIGSSNKTLQIEGIRSIKEFQLHHLLPTVSKFLRKEYPDKDLYIEVLNLHESYGADLSRYHAEAIDDYDWILEHSEDEDLLCEFIEILRARKDRRFLYPIITLLTHNQSNVRTTAIQYLTDFKDDRILPAILQLGSSENPLFKYYYLESLRYLHDERAFLHTGKLLTDPNPTIRFMTIKVLSTFPMKDNEQSVLNLAKNDPNFEVRKASLEYGMTTGIKKHPAVQYALQDSNKEVRETALQLISKSGDKLYASPVSKYLETEPNPVLQVRAIEILLQLKNDGGGLGLTSMLLGSSDTNVKKLSAFALGELSKTPQSSSVLNRSLESERNYEVKKEVIRAISKKKDRSSVALLIGKIKDMGENLEIRKESILALKEISEPQTLPEMFDLIDEHKEIQEELKEYVRYMLSKVYSVKNKYKTGV